MRTIADDIFEFIKSNSPCKEKLLIQNFGEIENLRDILRVFEDAEIIRYEYPSLFGGAELIAIENA